jgi:malate dehydrogenase (oxaloacetate-decarboxylating)
MSGKTTIRRERGGHFIRTFELVIRDKPGMFARVAEVIAKKSCVLGDVQIIRVDAHFLVRRVTVYAPAEETAAALAKEIGGVSGVRVVRIINDVMEAHVGGKVAVRCKAPVETMDDFRKIAYPGVLEACRAIQNEPRLARRFTLAGGTVAVVTNGQDVLGLGDIGPQAALPYAEGIAALLSCLGPVNAVPVAVDMKEVYGFVSVVQKISPTFAGMVLGGIAEPDVWSIRERLEALIPIPVFMTGFHGMAVSALAAVYKGLNRTGRKPETTQALVSGTNEAACSMVELLKAAGFERVLVADREGAIYSGRPGNQPAHIKRMAEITNWPKISGSLRDVLAGRDVYIGFYGEKGISASDIKKMARDPIVLLLGEPKPEISVHAAQAAGAFIAADRSTITITHGLCGIVRGTLDAGASAATAEMCIAAAKKLAELSDTHRDVLALVVDPSVHEAIAKAVALAVKK